MTRRLGHTPVAETPRELRLDGWCPCCAAQVWDTPTHPVVAIAEAVRLCGFCHRRGHHEGAIAAGLLEALVTGVA